MNPIEKSIMRSMATEIKRLKAKESNPVEHYIQIQMYDDGRWHTASQRFELTENQQAFVELGKWRTRFPDSKFRLVSIAVTLLAGEQESE